MQDEILVLFHRSRLVWIHPSYPFVDLFPRIGSKIDHQSMSRVSEIDAGTMKDQWLAIKIDLLIMIIIRAGLLHLIQHFNYCNMDTVLISMFVLTLSPFCLSHKK